MSDQTTNLQLPYLAPGQAQKHVTLNESLRRLDAIVQLSCVSATTAAEPASPADGAVYIVPAGKTGAHWSAYANGALACYRDGAWEEIAPREGWLAFARDTDALLRHDGSAWGAFGAANLIRVSATDRILGRATSGAGAAEEIACTAAGRALIDDADAAAQRATLGLGSAALQATGTSGASVPLCNGANTWSAQQTFSGGLDSGFRIAAQGGGEGGEFYLATPPSGTSLIGASVVNDVSGDRWRVFDGGGSLKGVYVDLTTANGPAASMLFHGGASALPDADNTINLGSSSRRFATLYAATGTINTSDAREKTALAPLPAAALRVARRLMGQIGVFQWREAVARKGASDARLHVGLTAQAVRDAFEAEGLDPRRWALYCADDAGDGEEALGLRADQLMWLALAGMAKA